MKKGQGAFEYVLLLGGVLLIVVLAVVLLRGGLFESSSQNVQLTACQNGLVTAPACFKDGEWNKDGVAMTAENCREILNTTAFTSYRCDDTTPGGAGAGNCFCGPSIVE